MLRHVLLAGAVLALAATPAVSQELAGGPPKVERRIAGSLTLENVPVAPPEVREQLRRYQNARSAGFADWLADGSMLISTRFGQTNQLHRVAAPGGDRTQITFFDEPVSGATARPGTNTFIFARDTGGDEYFQGYLAGLSGPETPITAPKTRNQSFVFSNSGKTVYWSQVTPGDGNYDIVAMDLDKPGSRRLLLEGTGAVGITAIAPNDRVALVQQYLTSTASKLFILDLTTGGMAPLNNVQEPVAYDGGAFTAEGRSVLVLSDQGGEFKRLVEIELATGKVTPVTPADLKWDVEAFDLSPDGRVLAYAINEGGRSRVVVRDFRTRRALPQPTLPVGVLTALDFSPDGAKLAIGMNTSTSPADVWSWDVAGGVLTRWTTSESGGLDPATLVDPSLVSFKSFDGLEVPAWVYRPRAATGPSPVIIDIHGGPESQSRPGFNSRIQYWVAELGATVIVPNVRGSDGYGKSYLLLDNGPKRQDSVRDIGALLDWVATQPDMNKDKVVVYGGSYGGFMVLASLAAYSDRLAGAVDIVGISNWTTFLTNTEGYRRDNRRAEYGDERDPKMKAIFDAISPLNLTAGMRKPLFVIQGRNDPRVPWTEAEQIVAKVRGQGGDVWYMIAADEGHGFKKKQNVDAQREAETLFFRKVFSEAAPKPATTPPLVDGVYIAEGICFGEGDCFAFWRAEKPVEIRARIDPASPVIATVQPGEWVEPVEGQLRFVPLRGVVTRDVAETALRKGDVVYMLEPLGEGDYVLWHNGRPVAHDWTEGDPQEPIAWDDPVPVSAPVISGWWVRVRLADGRTGWINDPEFECMGKLQGSSGCRE